MSRIALLVSLLGVSVPAAADEPTRVVATSYYRTFSHSHPVLKSIKPGEVVATRTIDSAGLDERDVKRSEPSNPLTGPFYVEGAEPGDALVVHLRKLRLNRDWGWSAYRLGLFALTPEVVEHIYPNDVHPDLVIKGRKTIVPWDLDRKANTVRLRTPKSQVHDLEFPARPMLGCIGVAPAGDFAPTSGPSGSYGGNLDYNQIGEGAIVSLPVYHPGGLLFLGDGHALQADGEPTGTGIETSMDVEFVVELKKAAGLNRAAGRDGRGDHQHWLTARIRQRPGQRPEDGHQRHGRLAGQGLRDGALGGAPTDRLPGALRRSHGRRVDGTSPAEEPAAEEGRRLRRALRVT
jgi:acetamidase/formamidase